MILQLDTQLRPEVNEWGCYKMDLLFAANKYTHRGFNQTMINKLYTMFVNRGWMDTECTVLRPDAITGHVGLETQIVIENGTHKLPPDRTCGPDEFEVQRWTYKKLSHFVFADPNDGTVWDSYGVSKCLSKGTMADKRVFRRL